MSLTVLAAVSAINDASTIIAALSPLVHQAMQAGETEISDEAVQFARDNLTTNIDALDAAIEKAKT